MENIRGLESGGSDSKESACNAGDLGSIPELGRSPGGGHGNPLQYSCLENPHGQRSLGGYSPWRRRESDTTERVSAQNLQEEKSTMNALRSCGAQPEGQPCLAWMPVLHVACLNPILPEKLMEAREIYTHVHPPTPTRTRLQERTSAQVQISMLFGETSCYTHPSDQTANLCDALQLCTSRDQGSMAYLKGRSPIILKMLVQLCFFIVWPIRFKSSSVWLPSTLMWSNDKV